MSCKMNMGSLCNLYIFMLLVLVYLLSSSAQDSFPLPTFLIPFYLWSPLKTAYKTKLERSIPNLFLITSHFIISQNITRTWMQGSDKRMLSGIMLDHSIRQQLFSTRRQQTESCHSLWVDASEEDWAMFAVELDWKSKLGTDALTMTIHLRLSSYWYIRQHWKRYLSLTWVEQ